MRKLFIALLSACLSLASATPALATVGYTTVVSTQMTDGSGQPLASGTATLRVVDNGGHPLSVKLTGGGQIITAPFTAAVTNGVFTIPSIDVSQSVPSFPCVQLTVTNDADGSVVWQNNCLQPTGGTYSLDQFTTSTTPIYPQAGDTVGGNLSVNGNLSVTGNLAMGGLTADTFSAVSTNGVVNAAQFAGSDIGLKVNAAYAFCSSTCEVDIPPGTYSYSTDIVMPNTASTTLRIMAGATLNYTGTGYAIRTSQGPAWGSGSYQGDYFINGGVIFGTSSAKGGILLQSATSGITIRGTAVTGFSSGDGFLDVGADSVKIADSKAIGNLVGIHLMASPSHASNNVLVERTDIAGNTVGAINGDVSQWTSPWIFTGTEGVASPNFNDVFFMDTFEGNTSAVFDGLTTGSQYLDNYIEGNLRGIVLGMSGGSPLSSAQYTALYGIDHSNGGTSTGASVTGDYWTLGGQLHSMIEMQAANSPIIEGNNTNGSGTTCMVDVYIGSTPYVGPNVSGATNTLCQGGSAGWPFSNTIPTSLSVTGNIAATGTLSTGPITSTGGFTLNQGAVITGGGISNALGTIGPWVFYATSSAPSGSCSAGSLDIGTFGLAVCQSGTWTVK